MSGTLAFDSLMRDRVAPFLKAEGFRKQRQTFWQRTDEVWRIVNFQKSQFGTRKNVAFYVNIAVGSDRLLGQRPGKGPPTEVGCSIRGRLGSQIGVGPKSYDLRGWAEIERLWRTLAVDLDEYALPFLQRFDRDDDVLDFFEELMHADGSGWPLPLREIERLATAVGRASLAQRARSSMDPSSEGPRLIVIESWEPHGDSGRG